MFRELFGLPAHALIVHAAVVFIPLATLAAILYAVWPALRKYTWWAVLGLGVLAPASGWAARLSGDQYKEWWTTPPQSVGGSALDEINNHQSLGDLLSWWTTGLGVAMLVMVLYAIPAPVGPLKGGPRPVVVQLAVAAVTVVVAAVTLYYAIRTGDAGARTSHPEI